MGAPIEAGADAAIAELAARFERRFGRAPEFSARAPGRVNLIGEHTDYNDGLVLPCAIDRHTLTLGVKRGDDRWQAYSREMDELREFDARAANPPGGWIDYLWAVVRAFRAAGHPVGGINVAISSAVPVGSGLSSSAALMVSVATLVDRMIGSGLAPRELALVAHRAESTFMGVGCGVMDPFACALAEPGRALRIDCRSLEVEAVSMPENLRLLIAGSGVERGLVEAGYRERVDECKAALVEARRAGIASPEAPSLRELTVGDLPALERALSTQSFRRVRHVVRENERVDCACAALRAGDLAELGRTLKAGMRSLREDFEVSTPELDRLCEVGDATRGVYGSRLTGAGFGGCTLHLLDERHLESAIAALAPHAAFLHILRPARNPGTIGNSSAPAGSHST